MGGTARRAQAHLRHVQIFVEGGFVFDTQSLVIGSTGRSNVSGRDWSLEKNYCDTGSFANRLPRQGRRCMGVYVVEKQYICIVCHHKYIMNTKLPDVTAKY
jgi:hypothetical protein